MNSLDTTGSLSSTPAQSTTATGTRPTTAVNQPAAYSSQTSIAEGQQAFTTTHPVTTGYNGDIDPSAGHTDPSV